LQNLSDNGYSQEQHISPIPGPVISRKTSLGGLFTVLNIVLFAGLTVFLVFDFLNTTTTSAALLPFGYQVQEPAVGPRCVFQATFYALTAPCVCSSVVFWAGLTNSSCTAAAGPGDGECLLSFDTGPNATFVNEALVKVSVASPATAAAMAFALSIAPHYDAPQSITRQGIALPLGGVKPVRVNMTTTYAVHDLADETEQAGWHVNVDSVEAASPPDLNSTINSVALQVRLLVPSQALYIQEQRTESVVVLLATIFSFSAAVWLVSSFLISWCERWQRDMKGEDDWPPEVAAFQQLYEHETHLKAEPPAHCCSCCRGRLKRRPSPPQPQQPLPHQRAPGCGVVVFRVRGSFLSELLLLSPCVFPSTTTTAAPHSGLLCCECGLFFSGCCFCLLCIPLTPCVQEMCRFSLTSTTR
jgi:hypothetical protein